MHTVVRNYSGKGAQEMLALLDQHKAELDGIFRGIKGFVSYVVRGAKPVARADLALPRRRLV